VLCLVAVTFALAAPAAAQRQGGPPAPRQASRIDPLSASIYGRITTADSGAPVRRAEVRALNDRGITRLATTDADGRYELRDMPAGAYRITVSKSGFVTVSFGQRRTAEAVKTIELAEGQRVAANISLPRGSAIAGRILDDAGEPVADVRVQALRSRIADGRRRLQPAGVIDVTDDTGSFRLFGLEPGDYYVTAMIQSPTSEDARMSAVTGPLRGDVKFSVPVFFPGVTSQEQAQPVLLTAGSEARADIFLAPLRTARVSGVVLTSSGTPGGDALVELRSDALNMGFSAAYAGPPPMSITAHAEPDGTFELPNVPPGSYTLIARVQNEFARGALDALANAAATGTPPPRDLQVIMQSPGEQAAMPLVVANADVAGLTLVTSAGGTLNVTFAADAGITRPLPRGLEVQPVGGDHGGRMQMTGNQANEIRLLGLTGPTRLRVTGLPDDWAVKAMLTDGTDVTDSPIIVRGGSTSVRVVLTDRVTEVSGTVSPVSTDARDAVSDSREQYVVVFAADSAKWAYPSRFVRGVRTDAQGNFSVKGLPGNERYLAVAVDYLEAGEAEDPQFLEGMRGRATPVSLNEGERRTIALRPVAR
jgi:hypothetical protein